MSAGVRVDPADVAEQSYYTHAIVRPGHPVFLTGQVAWDVTGAVVGAGDIKTQIALVWTNITAVLRDLGATTADIVKLTTYALDRKYIPAIHAERAKHFAAGAFPASTFIQVAGLADEDLLVEVEATLILPDDHPAFATTGGN